MMSYINFVITLFDPYLKGEELIIEKKKLFKMKMESSSKKN